MASASSHRYQSRLFNFIHKQSRLLTNRLNRVFKSLQAVTSWIAPIVFYPSLPQETVKQNVRQLPETPPTVDTPIQQVLLLVETMPSEPELKTTTPSRNLLGFLGNNFFPKANTKLVATADSSRSLKIEDNNTPSSLIPIRPLIRGIASQISNRLLVLVSPQNEILDILTSQQQQVLQARIISEVTNWRLQNLLQSPETTPQLPTHPSWLLAPTNLFSSIVSWTQRDKQQEKLSVFPQDAIASGAARGAIASIDRTIAKLETENLAPIASITRGFQIQGLIWAAIEYFFGDSASAIAEYRTPKLPQPTTYNLEDPWLTMSDLFGSQEVTKQSLGLENIATSNIPYLPEDTTFTRSAQKLNKYSLRSSLNRWRHLQKNSVSLAVKTPQNAKSLAKTQKQKPFSIISKNSNISQKLKAAINLNSPSIDLGNSIAAKSSECLENTPDWIETNATTMGYVKHPLEQLLEWLDLAMLWLENMLVKFWHWLQQR
ncbi:MAG: hypothetical protein KME01_06335 [Chroococcus sp. CMT-3BRIN-NPC107]|jgi:hypothetical protein|nr:hypothetical protein [Chroococcus sp. CMT-3BRIN-NPC107]